MKADAKETSGGLSDKISCDNMLISLKGKEIENVNGGYLEVFWELKNYLFTELVKQM